MLHGTVGYVLKDGKQTETVWAAKAHLVKEEDELRMDFYQVFLVSSHCSSFARRPISFLMSSRIPARWREQSDIYGNLATTFSRAIWAISRDVQSLISGSYTLLRRYTNIFDGPASPAPSIFVPHPSPLVPLPQRSLFRTHTALQQCHRPLWCIKTPFRTSRLLRRTTSDSRESPRHARRPPFRPCAKVASLSASTIRARCTIHCSPPDNLTSSITRSDTYPHHFHWTATKTNAC